MKSLSTSNRNNGFTLIEILLAIAILMVIFGLGLFASFDLYRGYSHRSERDVLVSVLIKARSRALNNISQSAHGVCIDTAAKTYNILCTASNCPGATEERVPQGTSASVSGMPSCGAGMILFAQLTGDASGQSTITVDQAGTPQETITINDQGTIIW